MNDMTDAIQDIQDTTLLQDILSVLEKHGSVLAPEAREQATEAFIRSLGWMAEHPECWAIRKLKASHITEQLDKPQKVIVRGRVMDVYKAQTITQHEPL